MYNILKNDHYYNEIMNLFLLSSGPVHFTVCTQCLMLVKFKYIRKRIYLFDYEYLTFIY